MTPREVLIAAKALIDTPEKWTQGAYRRDRAFCALGAIHYITRYSKTGVMDTKWAAINALLEALPVGYGMAAHYNDRPGRRHSTIMRWFDRAIAAAGES